MSLANVKTYLRTRLNSQGLSEFTEAIDTQNIPMTAVDKSYQLIFRNISRSSNSNEGLVLNYNMQIKIYRKGFRSTHAAVDFCAVEAESAISNLMAPQYRLTQTVIKNVNVDNVSIDAFAESNDNLCVTTLDASFLVFFCL